MTIYMHKKFVEDGLALAEKCTIFDRPLKDMSREELIAIAALTLDAAERLKENLRDTNKRLLDLAVKGLK